MHLDDGAQPHGLAPSGWKLGPVCQPQPQPQPRRPAQAEAHASSNRCDNHREASCGGPDSPTVRACADFEPRPLDSRRPFAGRSDVKSVRLR